MIANLTNPMKLANAKHIKPRDAEVTLRSCVIWKPGKSLPTCLVLLTLHKEKTLSTKSEKATENSLCAMIIDNTG